MNTGLEGSPILMAYPPDITINRIIAETRTNEKKTTYGNQHGIHRLWKVESPEVQQQLIDAFVKVKTAYLADGHHRLESAARLAEDQRSDGLKTYNTISALYMATDQLRIQEYDRVVIPKTPVNKASLLEQLAKNFEMQASPGNEPVQPKSALSFWGCVLKVNGIPCLQKPHTYANKKPGSNN